MQTERGDNQRRTTEARRQKRLKHRTRRKVGESPALATRSSRLAQISWCSWRAQAHLWARPGRSSRPRAVDCTAVGMPRPQRATHCNKSHRVQRGRKQDGAHPHRATEPPPRRSPPAPSTLPVPVPPRFDGGKAPLRPLPPPLPPLTVLPPALRRPMDGRRLRREEPRRLFVGVAGGGAAACA